MGDLLVKSRFWVKPWGLVMAYALSKYPWIYLLPWLVIQHERSRKTFLHRLIHGCGIISEDISYSIKIISRTD